MCMKGAALEMITTTSGNSTFRLQKQTERELQLFGADYAHE